MSTTQYQPGPGGVPYGNQNLNPQASNYAANSAYSPSQTILIDKAVNALLYNAAPKAYNIMSILFEKPFLKYKSDEFEYGEFNFPRQPIELAANVALVAPVVGSPVSTTITVTPASMENVSTNSIIVFTNSNAKAIVRGVLPGNQLLIESSTSSGIPAVNIATQSPLISVMSSISGDGRDSLTNYGRLKIITRP